VWGSRKGREGSNVRGKRKGRGEEKAKIVKKKRVKDREGQ